MDSRSLVAQSDIFSFIFDDAEVSSYVLSYLVVFSQKQPGKYVFPVL